MASRLDYAWHLRLRMAEQGMFNSPDLAAALRERGVTLSDSQVWRLVTGTPERLNLRVLVALVRHPGVQPERSDRARGAERRASPPPWPGGRRRCRAQAGTGQEAWPRSLIVTAFAAVGCAVRRGRSRSARTAISLTSAPAAGPPTRAVGGAARSAASPAGSRDGRLTAGRCAFAAMTAAHRPAAARIAGR